MTEWNANAAAPRLHVHATIESAAVIYSAGATLVGLRELETCRFAVLDVARVHVFVDDVKIEPGMDGYYEWKPGFYAGRVAIAVAYAPDAEAVFYAHVGTALSKLGDEEFKAMVEEIRVFRASLLLDDSSASMAFGSDTGASKVDAQVRLARLSLHAPTFLREVRTITRAPHRSLLQTNRLVSLVRVKRLHPTALREPRIAAVASGRGTQSVPLDLLHVATPMPVPTFDTPSNRALKALLTRLIAQASALLILVQQERLGGSSIEQQQRRPRRERLLQSIVRDAKTLLTREPFTEVSRLETSATSLTQIAMQPAYASAYRRGTRALWLGVEGASKQDHLHVSPTWGVYESWCFVHLLAKLSVTFGASRWKPIRSDIVSAVESYAIDWQNGDRIQVHFQATFESGQHPSSTSRGWSLSRQRIPDIVVAVRSGDRCEFVVLDAKYRRKRPNVLEAMESAHIYHDSLRVHGKPPAFSVLLLPAESDVPFLDSDDFLAEHGVGTICQFSLGSSGIERCISAVNEWALSAKRLDAKQIS